MVIELVTNGKRSFLLSTIITLVIVFMLIISGPAQAVRVMLNTDVLNNQKVGETGVFYINITIGANEFIPISNISVEGLPDIPGSPGGTLVFKLSDINSIGASIQKGSYDIMLINRHGWVSSFGYGYGYSDNFGYPPFIGYGYGYQFSGYGYGYGYEGGDTGTGYGYDSGYGYGYGYGYEGADTATYSELKYKVTVDTTGAEAKTYNVAAKLNTGQKVVFIGKSSFTLLPLLSNPGFESGTSPWVFYTNGTGTFDVESPGFEGSNAARLSISGGGTNVQLYQEGITLEPDTRYRLSFAAYSTTGHDLEANLIKHISPYTNYGLIKKFNLSTSWQSFAIEFTTKGFTTTVNDGRLMFYLAPFATAGDNYYIDNVRLEKVPDLVKNSDFESGTSPWVFYTDGTGTFDVASPGFTGNNAAKLDLSSEGTNVQLYQEGITLEPETRYMLSFAAYSTTGNDLEVRLIKHISPFTNYGLGQKFDLNTDWHSFNIEFTTKDFTTTVNDGRLMFYFAPIAAGGDTYYVDNVRLEKV